MSKSPSTVPPPRTADQLIADPPIIWKTKLRSKIDKPDWKYQFQHCRERNIIGVGWCVDLPSGSPLEDVCELVRSNPSRGWGKRSAGIIARFANEAKVGEFVWTRDLDGKYWICRIAGEYRYENDAESRRADVLQVRDVEWAPEPLNDLSVPGTVTRNFSTPAESFCKIWGLTARQLTVYWWEILHGRSAPNLDLTHRQVVETGLDPYDVEDLVFLWLQVERDYLVLPRSRQRDMPVYEWTLVDRNTRELAIAQVKSGTQSVNVDALLAARTSNKMKTFAFSTNGEYSGDTDACSVIEMDEIIRFANSNRDLLSGRIRGMFELADG